MLFKLPARLWGFSRSTEGLLLSSMLSNLPADFDVEVLDDLFSRDCKFFVTLIDILCSSMTTVLFPIEAPGLSELLVLSFVSPILPNLPFGNTADELYALFEVNAALFAPSLVMFEDNTEELKSLWPTARKW